MTVTNSMLVGKFYQMDPQFDDLIPNGTELKDGYIVLIGDPMFRQDIRYIDEAEQGTLLTEYELDRANTTNRWATVSHHEIIERAGEPPLVSFVANYGDGTKRKRVYCSSIAWLVKKDSL